MSASENDADQTIVINDLLSFVWCKLKLIPRHEVLRSIQEFYSEEERYEAFKTLLTALPSNTLSIQRKVNDSNPSISILNLLEKLPSHDLPIFVCKNLNNIPKLDATKKEPARIHMKNKKEFFKEHQRIKAQLNEVFGSLYELKNHFQSISSDEKNKIYENQFLSEVSPPKNLAYLQNLIDEEQDGGEVSEGNDLSDLEEDISEQQIHLIANRHQRASLKKSKEKETSPLILTRKPTNEKTIKIESDGKALVSDFSEYGTESFEEQDKEISSPPDFSTLQDVSSRFLIVDNQFEENVGYFNLFRCSSCSFCSNDEVTALQHACIDVSFNEIENSSVQLKQSLKDQIKESKTYNRLYECHSCSLTFKMRRDLQKHIETHLERGHRCPLCTNRFSLDEWQEHVRNCPGNGMINVEDIYCEICDVFYAHKRTLSFHKAFHDPSRPFECLQCKFRFYTQKTVEDHLKTHKMHRNSKKCPLCDFRSAKQIKIIDHLRCHTGDRPYKCPKCEGSCPTFNALKVHLTSHAQTRDFPCDLCGKKFKSRSKVASHRKTHTTERPHKCPICGKGFKFGLQMTLHHRMHLDIRKHACPQCPYKARTAAILRGHMNTHTNEKPFRCTKCDFGANHKSYLNWHLRYYHPNPSTDDEKDIS